MKSYMEEVLRAGETQGRDARRVKLFEGAQYYMNLVQNAINGHRRSDAPLILYALETCARVMRDDIGPGARATGDEIVKQLHELLDEALVTVDVSELTKIAKGGAAA